MTLDAKTPEQMDFALKDGNTHIKMTKYLTLNPSLMALTSTN